MLEKLWFGEDDHDDARRLAGQSVAAATAVATGLKPFPVFAARAISLLANPSFDANEVRSLIEREQAIATRVLRTATSAAFRGRTTLTNLKDVITRLGSREVQAVIASVATMDLFEDVMGYGHRVRQHGVGVAAIARVLARGRPCAPEAFLCGLMHDVGKLLILQAGSSPYEYVEVVDIDAAEATHALERRSLNYDHALLGAFVLGEWGFSEQVSQAVALHHQPMRAEMAGETVADLVAFVRLADRVEYLLRHDGAASAESPREDVPTIAARLASDPSAERLDLGAKDLVAVWPELARARQEMMSLR
jgi:putative nucleotidyltransferase with HDIG domain